MNNEVFLKDFYEGEFESGWKLQAASPSLLETQQGQGPCLLFTMSGTWKVLDVYIYFWITE